MNCRNLCNSLHHSHCFSLDHSRHDRSLARPYDVFSQRLCYFYNKETWANPRCGEVITPGIGPKQTQKANVMLWLRKLPAVGRLLDSISDSETHILNRVSKWCKMKCDHTQPDVFYLYYGNILHGRAGDANRSQKKNGCSELLNTMQWPELRRALSLTAALSSGESAVSDMEAQRWKLQPRRRASRWRPGSETCFIVRDCVDYVLRGCSLIQLQDQNKYRKKMEENVCKVSGRRLSVKCQVSRQWNRPSLTHSSANWGTDVFNLD